VDVRKELLIACCECLNCTGGDVDILSAALLSLPSQQLNLNHMRRRLFMVGPSVEVVAEQTKLAHS